MCGCGGVSGATLDGDRRPAAEADCGPSLRLTSKTASHEARDTNGGAELVTWARTLDGGLRGGTGLGDLEPKGLTSIAFDGKVCEVAEAESVPDSWSGSSTTRVGTPSTRSSRRLAIEKATPILIKVVARKARLEARVGWGGGFCAKPSIKKILERSKMCGVRLDDGEANPFREFVGNKS